MSRRFIPKRHHIRRVVSFVGHWLRVRIPLALGLGTVYAVYLVYRAHDITPFSAIDTRLMIVMGVAYAMAAVVMFFQNTGWSLKAIGQWITYVADAQLWFGVGAGRIGWRHELNTHDLQILRSWFVVGCAALILGIVVFEVSLLWGWLRPHRQQAPATVDWTGDEDWAQS